MNTCQDIKLSDLRLEKKMILKLLTFRWSNLSQDRKIRSSSGG